MGLDRDNEDRDKIRYINSNKSMIRLLQDYYIDKDRKTPVFFNLDPIFPSFSDWWGQRHFEIGPVLSKSTSVSSRETVCNVVLGRNCACQCMSTKSCCFPTDRLRLLVVFWGTCTFMCIFSRLYFYSYLCMNYTM